MSDLPLIYDDLPIVTIDELIAHLTDRLQSSFEFVRVEHLSECPDLSESPFDLATKGLGKSIAIALDVGGVPNLVPTPKLSKPDYSIVSICNQLNLQGDQLGVIGAAAGPFRETGVCCELIPNVQLTRSLLSNQFELASNRTRCALLGEEIDSSNTKHLAPKLMKMQSDRFALLGNLFVHDGHQGPVIRIHARKRLNQNNEHVDGSLPVLLQSILKSNDTSVSLAGVVLIRKGKLKMHIMPDFVDTPLETPAQVDDWLNFFEFDAPMFCATVLHSNDRKQLGLRVEHTHGYSIEQQKGGHFHYDRSPDVIEYEAYLRPMKQVIRVDRPQ